jgi:predicted nucleic acid-binding protein
LSIYLDASFVVSLYGPDSNFLKASNALQHATGVLFVSALCELESANAFRLRVFRKDATAAEAQRSIDYLDLDLGSRILERRLLPESSFVRAHRISSQHSAQLGTRGADLLHVAAALELGADQFFSFDLLQRKLASAVGLSLNPL